MDDQVVIVSVVGIVGLVVLGFGVLTLGGWLRITRQKIEIGSKTGNQLP